MKHILWLILFTAAFQTPLLSKPVKGPAPGELSYQVINSSSIKLIWQGSLRDYIYTLRYRVKGSSQWTYYSIEAPTTVRRVFNLVPATWYEWQVQTAFSSSKKDTSSFVKGPDFVTGVDCHAPDYLNATVLENNKTIFRWEMTSPEAVYTVRVREKGKDEWSIYQTSINNLLLSDLNEGKIYQWDVSVTCDEKLHLESSHSEINTVQLPVNNSTNSKWQSPYYRYENLSNLKSENIQYITFIENKKSIGKFKNAFLVNVMGERLMTLPVYYKSNSGEVAFELSDNILPGVYSVEFLNSGEQISKPIIISSR